MGVGTQHRMQDINCHPHVEFFNDTHGRRAGTSVLNQDALPSHEQYKSNIGGANIYAPFKSELDWKTAQWAKMRGLGSTVFSELLSIPGVCVLSVDLSES